MSPADPPQSPDLTDPVGVRSTPPVDPPSSDCCTPQEQESCCEPSAKSVLLRSGAHDGTVRLPMTPAAMEAVWQEMHAPLLRFIARRVSDPRDAEDVLQDVMLRIHRHAGEMDDFENVGAWVHQVTRTAIVDFYRRRAARPEQAAGTGAEVDEFGASAALDAAEPDDGRSELARCLQAVAATTARQVPRGAGADRVRRPQPGRGRRTTRTVDVRDEGARPAGPGAAARRCCSSAATSSSTRGAALPATALARVGAGAAATRPRARRDEPMLLIDGICGSARARARQLGRIGRART